MATYTKTLDYDSYPWCPFGSGGNCIAVDLDSLQLPSNEFPTSIQFSTMSTKPSGKNTYCAWVLSANGTQQSTWGIWLCDSEINKWSDKIVDIVMNPDPTFPGVANNTQALKNETPVSNGWRLTGSRLYICTDTPSSPAGLNPNNFQLRGYNTVIVKTSTISRCTAPSSVTVTRNSGVVTINWTGASAGTGNPITGYTIIRNTSKSETNATVVHSGVSASGQTDSPGSGTWYYGVKTLGTWSGYDSTSYTWSSSITVPNIPSVSQWTNITKAQMDTARTYYGKGDSAAVTRYAVITKTMGDKYKTATQYANITASWYNGIS